VFAVGGGGDVEREGPDSYVASGWRQTPSVGQERRPIGQRPRLLRGRRGARLSADEHRGSNERDRQRRPTKEPPPTHRRGGNDDMHHDETMYALSMDELAVTLAVTVPLVHVPFEGFALLSLTKPATV